MSCNSFFNGHKVDVADKKGVLTAKGEEYTDVAQQHRRLWPRLAARAPPEGGGGRLCPSSHAVDGQDLDLKLQVRIGGDRDGSVKERETTPRRLDI